jgi:GTP-binding protein
MVADVGLVGLPNAGKSTLLSVVSNAKPEIANYPFTTLIPNLGVVDIDSSTFLMADIPGLIEGASEGKGLGDEFLRHVERTRLLLHLIDVTSPDVVKDYQTIQAELQNYKVDLSDRPQLVVLTKSESVQEPELKKKITLLAKAAKLKPKDIHSISAVASMGIAALLRAVVKHLQKLQVSETKEVEESMPVIRLDDTESWQVEKVGERYAVTGSEIEGFAKRTNTDQYQAVQRLRHVLQRKGVLRQIEKLGGTTGSTIEIAGKQITL